MRQIEYSIWGDSSELANQISARRRVQRPRTRTSRSRSRCPTGMRTGTSCRPASRVATRPTSSPWTARSSPTTSRAACSWTSRRTSRATAFDLTALADAGVAHFTTPDGQFGLPRDLNVVGAVLQQGHVRRGRPRLPRRHLDLGHARRGRQAADPGQGRRRPARPVGLLHRDHGHGELLVVAGVAERRRDHLRRPHADPARLRRGGRRHPAPPGPHLHRTRSCPRRTCVVQTRRRVRAGSGGHGVERLVAGARRTSPRASTWASHRCRPDRPARPPASTPRASWWPAPPRSRMRPGSS